MRGLVAAKAFYGGSGPVTDKKRTISKASGDAPVRRAWEPMALTKVGTFGDVLKGATGPKGDGVARRRD